MCDGTNGLQFLDRLYSEDGCCLGINTIISFIPVRAVLYTVSVNATHVSPMRCLRRCREVHQERTFSGKISLEHGEELTGVCRGDLDYCLAGV